MTYKIVNVPYDHARVVGILLKPGDKEYGNLGLSEPMVWLENVLKQNETLKAENEKLKDELWYTGTALGVIARWPRWYFNRNYVEEWVIRTAKILKRLGSNNWKDLLIVRSGKSVNKSRLDRVTLE